MKFLRCASAFFLCLVLLSVTAFAALPEHTGQYSNDFANILNDETKQYIDNNGAALEKATKAQIVVATVTSLEGQSVEQYALELGRKWGIGSEKENSGLLVLLAPTERKITVQVGYGLEGALNDAKIGRFLDTYAIPHLKNDDWNSGIHELYSALLTEVYKEYNMEVPSSVSPTQKEYYEEDNGVAGIIFTIIILLVIFSILGSKNSGGKGGGSNGGSGGGSGGSGGSPVGPFIGGYLGGYMGGRRSGGFGGGGFGGSSGGGFGGGGGFSGGGGSFGGGGGSRGF